MAGKALIPVSFCPLQKLQVILHFAFHQLFRRNRMIDIVLPEFVTKEFEVLAICVFGGGVEFDAGHGHVFVNGVEHLA